MLSKQNFEDLKEKQIAVDLTQQKRTENAYQVNDNFQNATQNKTENESENGIIKFRNFDEVEEEINLGSKIVDFEKYKNDRMEQGPELPQEPVFKSKLSKGCDEKFEFKNCEKDDSSRMEAVKEALKSYYSLMEEEEPEYKDEKERDIKQAVMAREKTERLQLIVTNCNRYIANRWPISKKGRERLQEVKDLRREAIKELGEHVGHPGWRLAGEYLKFGLKTVTAPVWAPLAAAGVATYYTGKWAGRVTKRIAKKTGRVIKRKAIRLADALCDSFGSWKAFGATLLAIGCALTWGTIANVLLTAFNVVNFIPWLLCSMVTAPRYLYYLAKGKVDLYGVDVNKSKRKVRCMAWSVPTPHRYWTWFKMFYNGGGLGKYIRPYGQFRKNEKVKKQEDPSLKSASNIEYIYNAVQKERNGQYDQYEVGMWGPTRDVYFHSTTQKFKKLFELFRYSNENDFDQIAERSIEDMPLADSDDDYDEMDENKFN